MLLVTFEVEDHPDTAGDGIVLVEAAHQWAEAVLDQPTNIVTVRTYHVCRPK